MTSSTPTGQNTSHECPTCGVVHHRCQRCGAMITCDTNEGKRSHFDSMAGWPMDLTACFLIATIVTPADPFSVYYVAVPLIVIWMSVRFAIVRLRSKLPQ